MTRETLSKLSLPELNNLKDIILEIIFNKEMLDINKGTHFNGLICRACGSTHCVKNGTAKGKQRFLCRDCKKTFGIDSNTILSSTKLLPEAWKKYVHCIIEGYSIRKSAAICKVCVKTSFYMRHKILGAINDFVNSGNRIAGIVEMDETFLAESFKGNHRKSGFDMPRAARKRGGEVNLRGISKEQICIGTAIDRNDNIIMKIACRGRITYDVMEKLYKGNVAEGSTICTDGLSSYKKLSKECGLGHRIISSGKRTDGIFNLSKINSLHSRLKGWLYKFKGVSTKHLPNYLGWFQWMEQNKILKDSAIGVQLWQDALSMAMDESIKVIRGKTAVYA